MSDLTGNLMRRTILVTGGRIALLALWFVAITLVYRQIGGLPDGLSQAGVLAFSLAAIKMFTTALGDPLDLDVVRRVPPILADDPALAVSIWRAAQQIRTGLALVVMLLALLLAHPIATRVFGDPGWAPALMLAGGAAAGEMLFRGYLSDFQSRERFGLFLTLEAGLQGTRIFLVMALFLSGALTTLSFLAVYTLSTAIVVVVAYLASGRERRALWVISRDVSLETWTYIRWVAPAMIVSAVTERLDIFLLSSLRGPVESGLYGALLPLILVPEVVIGFATGVLQPRVADLHARGRLLAFWGSICRLTVPIAVLSALIVWFFADTLISISIGPSYLGAAPALRILFGAVMAWFAVVPVALAFVVMTQPRATLAITLVQAVFVIGIGLLLIPDKGALGAAMAVFIMRVGTGAMITGTAFWLLRRPRAEVDNPAQPS